MEINIETLSDGYHAWTDGDNGWDVLVKSTEELVVLLISKQ